MVKYIKEVNFDRFKKDGELDLGKSWSMEAEFPEVPKGIITFFSEKDLELQSCHEETYQGYKYYHAIAEDGNEYFFDEEDAAVNEIFDDYWNCFDWEDVFTDKNRNAEIVQSRNPGMIPTDHMRKTIAEYLQKIVEENEDVEDVEEYVYDTYLNPGNGLTCTDEGIQLLMSDEYYDDFMTELFEDKDTFSYFMDRYDIYEDEFDNRFYYVGNDNNGTGLYWDMRS